MLNKSSLVEFVKKHSFAIELSFLLAFVALYFVPLALQFNLNMNKNFFNFSHIILLKFDDMKYKDSYVKNILPFVFAILSIIVAIIYFIVKRRMSLATFSIYFIVISCDIIFYLSNLFASHSIIEIPKPIYINIYISLVFFIILSIYRVYSIFINKKFNCTIQKKYITNKQRIEQLEKEIEELKKGSQE